MTEDNATVSALLQEAKSLRDSSRLEEAEALLQRVVSLAPEGSGAHLMLGSTLLELGRALEAIPFLERSASLATNEKDMATFSTFANARLLLSNALYALERYDDAVDVLDEVGQASEDHPSQLVQKVWMNTLYTTLAATILAKPELNRRDGDLERAIELTRRVCASDPKPTAHMLEPRVLLAHALSEQGDRPGALGALTEALYVARRFRGLDEGKAIPGIHLRLSELIRETGDEASILRRPFARVLSLYHALAALLEHRRMLREQEATD